jgi:hypothetical protein
MQSKLFAVAAVASGAAALKLDAPTNTLAQSIEQECHGTYAYQCIQEKVDKSLGSMVKEVADQRDHCLDFADDLRQTMLESTQALRYQLEKHILWDLREGLTEALAARLDLAQDNIWAATDKANYNMRVEADARIANTSDISLVRIRAQDDIKNMYYQDDNGDKDSEALKAQIRERMEEFGEAYLGTHPNGKFASFADAEIAAAEEVIQSEYNAFRTMTNDSRAEWNAAAAQAIADLDAHIAAQIAEMDSVIAFKTNAIQEVVDTLYEDFIVIFWNTIEEIYKEVSYYERQGLIWKALYQKDAFMAEIHGLQNDLLTGLAAIRAQLVAELAAERLGFVNNVNDNRTGFFNDTEDMINESLQTKADARQSMADTEAELQALLDSKDKDNEDGNLKEFVYDLASIGYSPKGFGSGHANGYQPYGRWVANAIQEQIDVYGDAAAALFQTAIDNQTFILNAKLANEKDALAWDNLAAQEKLNATGARLLDEITLERERIELSLSQWQSAQEAADEAQRDLDQIALVTTKNDLWKDLSWLVRKTLAGAGYGYGGRGGGHEHGLSAGPVYGYINAFAQSSGTGGSVPFDADYNETYGWGAEGPEDGYDPYGYGDWGWGYGYQQTQYKEIAAIMDNMTRAQQEFVEANELRIAASQAGLNAVHDEAWAQFQAVVDNRCDQWDAAVAAQNEMWANTVATRTATVNQAMADADAAIQAAYVTKKAEFDRMETEIRWHITAIYNYDVQHELNDGLTAARAHQDAICDARMAIWAAYLADVEATWSACVIAETGSLDANTAAATATLNAGKAHNINTLEAWKASQQARFAAWAADERAAVAQFVSDCQDAWYTIQASYCIKHAADGGIAHTGYGCSWGQGAGIGNAGFLKGVEVEAHDDILSYGQDLDIKHIHNEQGLIDEAVWWTMQGVEDMKVAQQARVDADQQAREAGVLADHQDLKDALTYRLNDSIAFLDAKVAELAARLLARENAAIAAVDADRQIWEGLIDDLRTRILWDIKELVWKLGYAQGYAYGAHDGHDAELLQAITDLKDEYEAAIVATLQRMADRVAAEQAAGDAANDAAWAELQAEMDRLTAEMNQAIADATAACEDILAAARAAQNASIAAATDALHAFIESRLAAWNAQSAQETANAKWQEDSYYRYSLLRLLRAKQDAIDAAVAECKQRWADNMAQERADGASFRAAVRTDFVEFTADTAAALAAAIAQDSADMDLVVATREASLDARLDDQQMMLEDAMTADREEMAHRLKEVYNYNSYDYDGAVHGGLNEHISAPYSHEQQRAFLNRLAYFMRDFLAERDARLEAMRNIYNAQIQNRVDAAIEQREDLERAIQDRRDASEKANERYADNLLEDYQEEQDRDFALLVDYRAACQATAASKAEELRKQIIYAMHILRYAGGRDSGSFGFGNFGSSYYGKGNSLTGLDTLDNYRLPESRSHGYAQVQDIGTPVKKLNNDPENRDRQEDALNEARIAFDTMVQNSRDDFADYVANEINESNRNREQVNANLHYATHAAEDALALAIDAAESAFLDANNVRRATMQNMTNTMVSEFQAIVSAQRAQVDGWFDEKIAYASEIYDSYYKEHLLQTLEERRNQIFEELDARKDTAYTDAANANQLLDDLLAYEEYANAEYNQNMFDGMAAFNHSLETATAAAAADIHAAFSAASEAELAGKNEWLDQLRYDWGYWLRYVWGYSGYEHGFYNDYDDTADYSRGGHGTFKYAGADGTYLDAGYQGVNYSDSGLPHLSGYGYGGIGGIDYSSADDHTGLAYGNVTGPSKAYGFTDSVLQPASELTTLLDGYSSGYGTGVVFSHDY